MPDDDVSRRSRFNPRLVRVEGGRDARRLLEELGADETGVAIMSGKMQHVVVSMENVQARAASIIKQVMLSKGGECAVPRDTLLKDTEPVRVLMMGTESQFRGAVRNLGLQPFGLAALSREFKGFLEGTFGGSGTPRSMDARGFTLELGARTLVMGVVNVTPDSFSNGGRFFELEAAVRRARQMVEAGADIIDIGGESTRPGADPVDLEEERRRTVPLIESIADVGVPVSIDTYKAELARDALDAGASIVNDVSGLRFDPDMIPLLAERGCPVVIMHMQGVPRNMQENPVYDDVVADVARFLRERASAAVEGGVRPDRIMIDPGIGFGKTLEHNLEIMRRLEELVFLGYPLVLGTSRKSFIGRVLDLPADRRVLGTAATVAYAISRGVDVVRVHDVEEMIQVARMADAMNKGGVDPGSDPIERGLTPK